MPLMVGRSDETVRKNITRLRREGYKQAQAVAISLQKAGRSNKQGKRK